jgi:hypothetical protein
MAFRDSFTGTTRNADAKRQRLTSEGQVRESSASPCEGLEIRALSDHGFFSRAAKNPPWAILSPRAPPAAPIRATRKVSRIHVQTWPGLLFEAHALVSQVRERCLGVVIPDGLLQHQQSRQHDECRCISRHLDENFLS